jgi:cytochrome c553
MSRFLRSFILVALITLLIPIVTAQGDATDGVQIYKDYCAACHGPDMGGGIGTALKGNSVISESDEPALVQIVNDGRETNGMPPFKEQLTEQEILDVVALLKDPNPLLKSVGLSIKEPNITTDDILPSLMKSFAFIFSWTLVAMVGLLAWIKHSH